MLGATLFGLFLTPVFYVVIRKFAASKRPVRVPRCLFENIRTELTGLGGRNSSYTPLSARLALNQNGKDDFSFSLAANSFRTTLF
jgi:hypothetical protein